MAVLASTVSTQAQVGEAEQLKISCLVLLLGKVEMVVLPCFCTLVLGALLSPTQVCEDFRQGCGP